jgi:hypothetical protein
VDQIFKGAQRTSGTNVAMETGPRVRALLVNKTKRHSKKVLPFESVVGSFNAVPKTEFLKRRGIPGYVRTKY